MNGNMLARRPHPNPGAFVPQGAQRVAVGGGFVPAGCGYGGPRGQWGTGNYGEAWASPNAGGGASNLPNMAPMGDPGAFVNPAQVLRQALVPIQIISQAEAGGVEKCVQSFPDHGRLYVNGARACNGCFEILLTRLTAGGTDMNRLGNTMIDAGIYNTDNCNCPIDLGCVQRDQPISMCFRAFGTPTELPYLNFAFFGTRDQAFNSCDPGLALALAAGSQYPMPQGG